jgi:TolB-like protein/Tfp pilus assembly protein PilF
MPGKPSNLGKFWKELKQRKVIRRNMVYAASGFVLLELVSIIAEPFGLPDWTLKLVFIILCIGFVISVIISWFYNYTPEGLERIKSSDKANDLIPEKPSQLLAWKITSYISIVIIIGLLVFNIARGRKQSEVLSELEKTIAVLPFDNLSAGEEYSHIGDAITDEIIMELQKISEFDRVLSRSSTMQYKDNRPTIPEIAKKLGVNYIIEGSIQLQNETVSIRVQVIRSEPEDHVWGNEYNGRWEDIFSIQDDIAKTVTKELKIVLSPGEIEKIEKKPTDNLEAYNLYLKGNYYWQLRTGEGFRKALDYFEQALLKDPNYALAYTGIAMVYSQSTFFGSVSPNEAYPKVKEYVKKALELDNTLAEAYVILGNINRLYDWNWKAAEQNFQKALQLNPNSANIHMWYAFLLAFTERFEEAILEAKRAQELDPLSSWINTHKGFIHSIAGQYDRAIKELQMTLVMDPDYWLAHHWLGDAYVGKFMIEEAIAEYEKAFDLSSDDPYAMAILANNYYESGQKTKADNLFDRLKQMSRDGYVPPMCFCWIYQARGEMDLYYEWLEKACNEHDGFLPWYRVITIEKYRIPDEPRYKELLKKAGLL